MKDDLEMSIINMQISLTLIDIINGIIKTEQIFGSSVKISFSICAKWVYECEWADVGVFLANKI